MIETIEQGVQPWYKKYERRKCKNCKCKVEFTQIITDVNFFDLIEVDAKNYRTRYIENNHFKIATIYNCDGFDWRCPNCGVVNIVYNTNNKQKIQKCLIAVMPPEEETVTPNKIEVTPTFWGKVKSLIENYRRNRNLN